MSVLIKSLLKENLITPEQLGDAKNKQLGAKKPIHELLVEMGFISEKDLIRATSEVFDMPVLNLKKTKIDPSAKEIISYKKAKRYGVFPVRKEKGALVLAMSNPQDVIALDEIRFSTAMRIKPVLSTKEEIAACIETYYQLDDTLYDIFKNIEDDSRIELIKEDKFGEKEFIVEAFKGENSPVVGLVNLVLNDAVKARASDIHIEPHEKSVEIRYRIDGDLRNIMKIPRKLRASFAARIKILANLNIAETRKPQEGRVKILAKGRRIDLRVSIIPAYYGEKIAVRVLDPKEAKIKLDEIGFEKDELDLFRETISRPQGIVLVTGPTGSGKTSTLYAALSFIKLGEAKNIITIEDPIEYLIEGISQMQTNPVKDITFANGLKSILRQDPDVVLVGEIRDKETAKIAFRASLTGHLVFSTLHTNDAVSSIPRLLDIGLEPYLIASSISLIVSQRLVRLICSHCKEESIPSENLMDKFKIYIDKFGIDKFYEGKGCEECGFTGFLGRTAIFEMLKIKEEVKDLIFNKASENQIIKEARKDGLKTLAESGVAKVAAGLTTLEEIAKVVDVDKVDKVVGARGETQRSAKVLVTDDEEDILGVLKRRLASAGYGVITARDGREAVEYAVKEKPDLIVMDVVMPNMDGFEATRVLRSKLQTATIPIVMLTAKQDKGSEIKGLDWGADDYITKPFDADKLLARLKMLLKRKAPLRDK